MPQDATAGVHVKPKEDCTKSIPSRIVHAQPRSALPTTVATAAIQDAQSAPIPSCCKTEHASGKSSHGSCSGGGGAGRALVASAASTSDRECDTSGWAPTRRGASRRIHRRSGLLLSLAATRPLKICHEAGQGSCPQDSMSDTRTLDRQDRVCYLPSAGCANHSNRIDYSSRSLALIAKIVFLPRGGGGRETETADRLYT